MMGLVRGAETTHRERAADDLEPGSEELLRAEDGGRRERPSEKGAGWKAV